MKFTKVIYVDGCPVVELDFGNVRRQATWYGTSTREKPTEGVNDADVLYEMDTQNAYIFDEESGQWLDV